MDEEGDCPLTNSTAVTIDISTTIPIVTVVGEIDIATAPLLVGRFEEIPIGSTSVIVDLTGVTFLDSTALGVLVAAEKRIHKEDAPGRSVHLVITRPEIIKLFVITGLQDVFPIFSTLEEAIARLEVV